VTSRPDSPMLKPGDVRRSIHDTLALHKHTVSMFSFTRQSPVNLFCRPNRASHYQTSLTRKAVRADFPFPQRRLSEGSGIANAVPEALWFNFVLKPIMPRLQTACAFFVLFTVSHHPRMHRADRDAD
jgi:hypothetical protein